VSPAIGGAIVLGYLIDLISGAPPGLLALVLALTTLVARAVQQRILVRGAVISIAFSAFVALVAGVVALAVRMLYRMPSATFTVELQHVAMVTLATAAVGPLMWRMFRRIDAAFARTHRERDAALEGLAP
jgi:rod shape-determining protein MreD